MRIAPAIRLSPEERTVLEYPPRSRSRPVRVVKRARIVLFAASGQQDKEIAAVMAITPKKVSRWRKRFLALGVAGAQGEARTAAVAPPPSARACPTASCLCPHASSRPTPRTGARAPWPRPSASAKPACGASGGPTDSPPHRPDHPAPPAASLDLR